MREGASSGTYPVSFEGDKAPIFERGNFIYRGPQRGLISLSMQPLTTWKCREPTILIVTEPFLVAEQSEPMGKVILCINSGRHIDCSLQSIGPQQTENRPTRQYDWTLLAAIKTTFDAPSSHLNSSHLGRC